MDVVSTHTIVFFCLPDRVEVFLQYNTVQQSHHKCFYHVATTNEYLHDNQFHSSELNNPYPSDRIQIVWSGNSVRMWDLLDSLVYTLALIDLEIDSYESFRLPERDLILSNEKGRTPECESLRFLRLCKNVLQLVSLHRNQTRWTSLVGINLLRNRTNNIIRFIARFHFCKCVIHAKFVQIF